MLLFTLIIYSIYFDSKTKYIFIDLHLDTSSSNCHSPLPCFQPCLQGVWPEWRGVYLICFISWLFSSPDSCTLLTFFHYLYFSKLHLPWVFQTFQSPFTSLTAFHILVSSVSVIYIRSLHWLWFISLPSLVDRCNMYSDWTWNIFSWPVTHLFFRYSEAVMIS